MKTLKKLTATIAATTILSTMTFTVSANSNSYIKGDINFDGTVNSDDSNLLRSALWGQISLSELQRTVADVNNDLHIDYNDFKEIYNITEGNSETTEITVETNENEEVKHYINNNHDLSINSRGWDADIADNITVSPYYLKGNSDGSNIYLDAYGTNISKDNSGIFYSNSGAISAKTEFSDGNFSTYYTADGKLYDYNSYLTQNSSSIVRKAGNYFALTNVNDPIFAPSSYGVNETVHLLNADITKREDGYEFVNNISDKTSYAFLGHKVAVMDDVTFYFDNGTFTFDGIDESTISVVDIHERDGYNEITLITDEYVYGLMYEPAFDMMAAFVRYEFKTGEAVLAQYTGIVDMATVAVHYAQDGVIEYGLEHPDLMVKWLDDYYDPDHMVFETVMYRNKMKCVQLGKMNDSYKIYDGLTYTQLSNGMNTIVKNHNDLSSTFMFGMGLTSVSNNAGGVFSAYGTNQYTFGSNSLTTAPGKGSLYSPDADITYKYNNGTEIFKVSDILNKRVPSMY